MFFRTLKLYTKHEFMDKIVNTLLKAISVWLGEQNILVLTDTGVPSWDINNENSSACPEPKITILNAVHA